MRGAPWDPWFRIGRVGVTTTVFVILLGIVSIVVYAVEPADKPIMTSLALWPDPVNGGEAWRLVTWPFSVLSFSIWSALTLLFLWWFGSDVERALGRAPMIGLFVSSILVMGVAGWALGTLLNRQQAFTELGLLSLVLFFLYCLEHPHGQFFFGIPVWVLGVVIAAINVISEVAARRWVHLLVLVIGTAVTAVIAKTMGYLSAQAAIPAIPTPDLAARRRARDERRRRRARERSHLQAVPDLPRSEPASRTAPAVATPDPEPEPEEIDPMDALLDKISESGMDSLTAEERERLDELSRRRRER